MPQFNLASGILASNLRYTGANKRVVPMSLFSRPELKTEALVHSRVLEKIPTEFLLDSDGTHKKRKSHRGGETRVRVAVTIERTFPASPATSER